MDSSAGTNSDSKLNTITPYNGSVFGVGSRTCQCDSTSAITTSCITTKYTCGQMLDLILRPVEDVRGYRLPEWDDGVYIVCFDPLAEKELIDKHYNSMLVSKVRMDNPDVSDETAKCIATNAICLIYNIVVALKTPFIALYDNGDYRTFTIENTHVFRNDWEAVKV